MHQSVWGKIWHAHLRAEQAEVAVDDGMLAVSSRRTARGCVELVDDAGALHAADGAFVLE